MTEERTLQSIIDPFVKGVGGELVSDLIVSPNPPSNADYYFRRSNVIAELKSLQAGGYAASFHRKLADLTAKWHRQRRFLVFGTVQVQSSKLPEDCREEMFAAMAGSIQKHVIAKANEQIRSTKALLGKPDAKGLLWVASDGNSDFQPEVVWYLLNRVLQKKKESGDLAYSSIDGVAYFNPRMPAVIANQPAPALFWFSRPRRLEDDQSLKDCLSLLSSNWPKYVTWAQGTPVHDITGAPADLRFPGADKLPRIEPNYD